MRMYFSIIADVDMSDPPSWLDVHRMEVNERQRFEELIAKEIEWNLKLRGVVAQVKSERKS